MDGFAEIADPPSAKNKLTAAQFQSGPSIDPLTRLVTYDSAEWEKFIDEWVSHCLKSKYHKVLRTSGANDKGIDVAGFADTKLLQGIWDNYQCKHYGGPIAPGDAWPEIGKTLWYSFKGEYAPPRACFFVAPRGTGTTLTQLLANSVRLKARVKEEWVKNIQDVITDTQSVLLEGDFAAYVDAFDFSVFKPIAVREVVEQHRESPYFLARFGGALPPRPEPGAPPAEIDASESRYVAHLLDAYADHTKSPLSCASGLSGPLRSHFERQRVAFYHAESLRVFVRDKVEPGTFESLQEEIYQGVVDTCESTHADGFECVKAVTDTAQTLSLNAHPLGPSAFVQDRRGICHQLANEDRLKWTK